jgi:hypothetical protein
LVFIGEDWQQRMVQGRGSGYGLKTSELEKIFSPRSGNIKESINYGGKQMIWRQNEEETKVHRESLPS